MSGKRFRHAVLLAVVVIVPAFSGCTNNEIPLVEFPKGAPPPPPASKPEQAKDLSGDPSQYSK